MVSKEILKSTENMGSEFKMQKSNTEDITKSLQVILDNVEKSTKYLYIKHIVNVFNLHMLYFYIKD